MNNIIGPISQQDWKTMRNLHESIKLMKKDFGRWEAAIADETERYYRRMGKYVRKEAA